ncbi:MAG: sigma-70 family RNA polymerase sigma factor [Actinomycetales bacterium]|jgi:RNA polymerase sigma-70 factor (ECF subfamily)|nr:sigma-70 family RNA polymerase sigma factor [Actinomycetales bacterium]
MVAVVGWEQALAELVATRGPALVGYAYLLCGDRREAEDLVQDALVKTFASARRGTALANTEGYVRRAVLTTYLDGFRRRRRWAAVRHLAGGEEVVAGPEAAVGDRLAVRDALAGLSPRERACVVLRFYEDLTVPRIADELALSEGAVKRYLSDAVRRLEATLGPVRPPSPTAPAADETLVRLVTSSPRRTR